MTEDHDRILILEQGYQGLRDGFSDLKSEMRDEVKFIRRLVISTLTSVIFVAISSTIFMALQGPR